MLDAVAIDRKQRPPVGRAADRLDPPQPAGDLLAPGKQRLPSIDGNGQHLLQSLGVARGEPSSQQLGTGDPAALSRFPSAKVGFGLFGADRRSRKRERGKHSVSHFAVAAPNAKDPDLLPVVVLLVIAVAGEPTDGSAAGAPLALKESRPVSVDRCEAIVSAADVDYYYCT